MPNPLAKGWNYLKASLDKSLDDNADPKILVRQAMDAARDQHRAVAEQAAAVIGNARQLEISMNTTSGRIDELQGQVRQSVQAADSARADGDEDRARTLDARAEELAARLVGLEAELDRTRDLHQQAVQAAEQAKEATAQSESRLREILAQEDQLLLQATQAEMEHRSAESMTALSATGGGDSPTFEEIRARIESRYTTALGTQELARAQGAPATAQLDAEALTRQDQGRARLEQIRAAMGSDDRQTGGTAAGPRQTDTAGGPVRTGTPADDGDDHPRLPRDARDEDPEEGTHAE